MLSSFWQIITGPILIIWHFVYEIDTIRGKNIALSHETYRNLVKYNIRLVISQKIKILAKSSDQKNF